MRVCRPRFVKRWYRRFWIAIWIRPSPFRPPAKWRSLLVFRATRLFWLIRVCLTMAIWWRGRDPVISFRKKPCRKLPRQRGASQRSLHRNRRLTGSIDSNFTRLTPSFPQSRRIGRNTPFHLFMGRLIIICFRWRSGANAHDRRSAKNGLARGRMIHGRWMTRYWWSKFAAGFCHGAASWRLMMKS